jgi:hypothetical protein
MAPQKKKTLLVLEGDQRAYNNSNIEGNGKNLKEIRINNSLVGQNKHSYKNTQNAKRRRRKVRERR